MRHSGNAVGAHTSRVTHVMLRHITLGTSGVPAMAAQEELQTKELSRASCHCLAMGGMTNAQRTNESRGVTDSLRNSWMTRSRINRVGIATLDRSPWMTWYVTIVEEMSNSRKYLGVRLVEELPAPSAGGMAIARGRQA